MSDSECDNTVPTEIIEAAKTVCLNLLPEKSKRRYTATYNEFKAWRKTKNTKSFAEDVLIVFFNEQAKTMASPSLWAKYSMIKACIKAYDNIDISTYAKLLAFLKKQTTGYKPKKSKVFTAADVAKFINEASDSEYLVLKVVLIFGITGALRREELTNLTVKDVENHNTMILIRIPKTKTGIERSFTVVGDFYNKCKKYMDVRLENKKNDRFFLKMFRGKCTNQPIGLNKIGSMPKDIAAFLKLAEPQLYTGHCFRRTSATLLVDGGGDITTLKRHGGWKSDSVAEGYIEDSLQMKLKICETITSSITPSTSAKRPHINTTDDPMPSTSTVHEEPAFHKAKKAKISEDGEMTSAANSSNTSLQEKGLIVGSPSENIIQKDLTNSTLLSNILKLDKNLKMEFNNCTNFTIHVHNNKET